MSGVLLVSSGAQQSILPADFAAMAELLPDLAWVADPRGRIIWGNQRWREYFGATPETIGDNDWSSIHDPDILPGDTRIGVQALTTGEPAEMAFPLRGADGVYRVFLTSARPKRNSDGEIV